MLLALQIVAVLLTSIAMALSLAHALELPGKLRLDKDAYAIVQQIYYPGFTIGGIGEILGLIAILALLFFTPSDSAAFGWVVASFVALLATHGAYWGLTHPVNKFWLKDADLKGAGAGFFGVGGKRADQPGVDDPNLWRSYRDRWEASHVLRAVLSMLSLAFLVVAVAL